LVVRITGISQFYRRSLDRALASLASLLFYCPLHHY
jgi:hypothetical protein